MSLILRSGVIKGVIQGIAGHEVQHLGLNMADYVVPSSRRLDLRDHLKPEGEQPNQWLGDIAGWACALYMRHGAKRMRPLDPLTLLGVVQLHNMVDHTAELFGIDEQTALDLINPDGPRDNYTFHQIIHCLGVLADTGKVEWTSRQEAKRDNFARMYGLVA